MEKDEYPSRIEGLKKKLYSRKAKEQSIEEQPLRPRNFDVPTDWAREKSLDEQIVEETLNVQKTEEDMAKKGSFLNKALIVAIVFFILAGVYALFSFTGGRGVISSRNIDIVVSGPISIAAGEVLSLQVDVRNKNDVDLELTDLLVEYPEGTREAENLGAELKRYRESLGDVRSGKNKEVVIDSVLFGEEGEKKTIKIGVEYRVHGSNAIFFTEREYQVEIVSSPISMEVTSPGSISSGQELEFIVKVSANSESAVNDVLLVAEYPFGFTFKDANVDPTYDDNVWDLGDLKPGSVKTIRARGVLIGQNEEERTFRFEAGIPAEFDEKVIGTPFLTNSSSIVIERPFMSIDVALNGSTSEEYVVGVGEQIRGDISWQNNLPSRVGNVVIEIELIGSILDRSSVEAGKGFFRSTDNTIVWDSRSIPNFSSLGAGETGTASFSFKPLGAASLSGSNIKSDIRLVANIYGDSFDDGGSTNRIVTTLEKNIDVSSSVDIKARALHFGGVFSNSGPMPPKVNSETTYTVVLSVSNLLNDITGTEVTATLPTYVRWMGAVDPPNENVVYNNVGGEVVWNVGRVNKGVGYSSPAKELAFKVALTPSISQVGSAPDIVSDIELEAQDTHTDERITDFISKISTRLTSDPQYIDAHGTVIQ